MESSTSFPSGSRSDQHVYLPQDFDCNTEARCSSCDFLVNVHKWKEHRKDCFIAKDLKCDVCLSEFNHKVNLTIHKNLKHESADKTCSICEKKFQRDSAFRGHVISHCVADKLTCDQCNDEFDSPMELNRHFRFKHSENVAMTEALICCYCGEIFSPLDLDAHKRTHTYERVLHKKFYTTKKKCETTDSHSNIRPHICSICGRAFRRPKELERHAAIHSEARNYKCPFCTQEFRHQNVLHAHEKLHKRTNKVFTCRICRNTFNTRFNLYRHLQLTHMKKDEDITRKNLAAEDMNQLVPFDGDLFPIVNRIEDFSDQDLANYVDEADNEIMEESNGDEWNSGRFENDYEQGVERWDLKGVTGCDLAEHLFENRQQLKDHVIVIPENSLRCPACIHAMGSIEHLMAHFQTLADDDSLHRRATFNCMFCQRDVMGLDVYSHLQSHGITAHTQPRMPVRIIPRPHVCPACRRSFTKNVDLTRHLRTHTGEKPFSCRVCGQKFSLESTQKRHEKVHLNVDAIHQCSFCKKGFSSRNALQTHMINHSTPCSVCNKTFKSAAEKDEHISREHANRDVGVRSRVGGMFLSSVPGGFATLSQISRPISCASLVPTSSSAFHSTRPVSKKLSRQHKPNLNVQVEDTAKEGIVMKLSRMRMGGETNTSSSRNKGTSLSFSVPHQLLSSLQLERGVLRTQLDRGRIVNMHPMQTLSSIHSTDHTNMHPVSLQPSQAYSQCVRSSAFAPLDINSDNYFVDHCNICDVSFSTAEESSAHMNSEDHETATLLTPHSSMESAANQMVCKLCGNRFDAMAPLVEHIRREHERDHPKSLAPLNLHTSHLISSNIS